MIQPPNFAKNAIPTSVGWKDPRTKELLVARKISQTAIDEYNGVSSTPAPQILEIVETNENQEILTEYVFDSVAEDDITLEEIMDDDPDMYSEMSKRELESLGREHGIELDRREKKATLIERLKQVIS